MSYVDPNLLAFLLLRLIQSTDSYEELDSLFLVYSSLTFGMILFIIPFMSKNLYSINDILSSAYVRPDYDFWFLPI